MSRENIIHIYKVENDVIVLTMSKPYNITMADLYFTVLNSTIIDICSMVCIQIFNTKATQLKFVFKNSMS